MPKTDEQRPAWQGDPSATPSEITFDAYEDEEGGYYAVARGYSIITQGDDWEELEYMVKDAAECYFDDGRAPETIKLRMARIAL